MRKAGLVALLGLLGACARVIPLPPLTPDQILDQLDRNAELTDRVRADLCLELVKKAELLPRADRDPHLADVDALCTASVYWSGEAYSAREKARTLLEECPGPECRERRNEALRTAKALSVIERDRFYDLLHFSL